MQAVVGVLKNTRKTPQARRLTIFAHPRGRPSSVTEITDGSAFHSAMVLPREECVSGAAHISSGSILSGLTIFAGIARNYEKEHLRVVETRALLDQKPLEPLHRTEK
jgi:hypothetical protein